MNSHADKPTARRRGRILSALLLAAAASVAPLAGAQTKEWPSRPIKIIVPFGPGGSTDTSARIIGEVIAKEVGQPVVIENKPGAQGTVGTVAAKASPPDGHTLVLMASSVLCVTPYMRKTPPFHFNDLAPVSMLGAAPLMLVISSSLGPKTIGEFVDLAKKRRGAMNYSSAGAGGSQHLYSAIFDKANDLRMQHVAYQSASLAAQAVVAGDVQMVMSDVTSSLPLIASGRLKALAIAGSQRSPRLPDVPTFSELNQPVGDLVGWVGIMAPAGTPEPIIARLSKAISAYTASAEGKQKLQEFGFLPTPGDVKYMSEAIQKGCPRWGEGAAAAGIQPE